MENIVPVIHLPNFGCLKTHFGTKYAVVKIGTSKLVPFIIARYSNIEALLIVMFAKSEGN